LLGFYGVIGGTISELSGINIVDRYKPEKDIPLTGFFGGSSAAAVSDYMGVGHTANEHECNEGYSKQFCEFYHFLLGVFCFLVKKTIIRMVLV
jgi:hypothetical protein